MQPREGNKVAQGHAVSQPRKWDDQGCLRGWSNAPTPGSQDRTCLLLSLRSSGHRGPHPSLSLRSASGDESAAARPHALLGSFPLSVPAGRQDCLHLRCHLRRQVGKMGPGGRRLPRRCSILGARRLALTPSSWGGVGGRLTVPRLQENWPRKSCSSSCMLDLSWSNRANLSFCTSSKW